MNIEVAADINTKISLEIASTPEAYLEQTEDLSKYVSFSRLDSYSKCSKYYQHKYVDKTTGDAVNNIHFLRGDAVHKNIEYCILNEVDNPALALLNVMPEWLSNHQITFNTDDIHKLGIAYGNLLYRCSESYIQKDKIRNKDGSVLKDPLNTPSRGYTEEVRNLGGELNRLKYSLDSAAGMLDPDMWIENSFANFITSIYGIMLGFKLPAWYKNSVGVEYPVSTTANNLVHLDKENKFLLKGYIDWIIRSQDNRLIICDHKTSTKKPACEDVMHHPQLNMYAYALHQLTGSYPDILAIHHARSGTYIMATFDLEIMEKTIEHYQNICDLIDRGIFIKHQPGDYQTPCLYRDYKTGLVATKCEYINSCWPIYNSLI